MTNRRRHGFTILPISWMWLIWHLSADSGSGIKSLRLARWVWGHVLTPLTGIVPAYPLLFATDAFARKCAHVTEYAILAVFMIIALRGSLPEWDLQKTGRWAVLLSVLWAAIDELHQGFVPGRGSHVTDVGIDSIGISLGTLLAIGLLRRWHRRATLIPAPPSP